MTDNETIKALGCCKDNNEDVFSCEKCPYHGVYECCVNALCGDAFDLLNRQKEEIERLKIENQALRGATNSYKIRYNKAKSEAIKEFAEKLEKDLGDLFMVSHPVVASIIDNLVKEVVGDSNG